MIKSHIPRRDKLAKYIRDLKFIIELQERFIDCCLDQNHKIYDRLSTLQIQHWKNLRDYETTTEAHHKQYNEVVRAYNALATLGKFAEELGINIKKHSDRLPEADLYKDFKITTKVMESGKVKNTFSAKKIKKGVTNE